MPIAPPAIHYTCTACGWSKTVSPRSDALMLGDYYSACPQCDHESLTARQANVAEVAIGQLGDLLQRLWR